MSDKKAQELYLKYKYNLNILGNIYYIFNKLEGYVGIRETNLGIKLPVTNFNQEHTKKKSYNHAEGGGIFPV